LHRETSSGEKTRERGKPSHMTTGNTVEAEALELPLPLATKRIGLVSSVRARFLGFPNWSWFFVMFVASFEACYRQQLVTFTGTAFSLWRAPK
jgi:hypothetical protein